MPISPKTEKFIASSEAPALLKKLDKYLKDNPLNVSDVRDDKYQYVDLVQQGGGIWGIALLGYTYILEKAGIRFFSVAGTSAGAINSMLLACIGNKEDEKSEVIVDELLNKELFDLVDGQPDQFGFTRTVKGILRRLVIQKSYALTMVSKFHWAIVLLLTFCFSAFIVPWLAAMQGPGIKAISLIAGLSLIIAIFFVAMVYIRFKKFVHYGNGLNKGDNFHHWIKNIISSQSIEGDATKRKIETLDDLKTHFNRIPPNLKVVNRTNISIPTTPMIVIVASDITSERKIEFPRMWDLYWKNTKDIHPADFVRASMSIPFFFSAYTLTGINKKSSPAIWKSQLNWKRDTIPDRAQFVDGGALSNFPISVFANPNYPEPRMPTFGIRLISEKADSTKEHHNTLAGYAGSIVGTMRANYDRDFINKNRAFELGVCDILIEEISWLNFFMTDKQKLELFNIGARHAFEFLQEFKWNSYKKERLLDAQRQKQPDLNPNNW
jgi:NTE family protein